MVPLSLEELARIVGGEISGGTGGAAVAHASIHSGRVQAGSLFFALRGEQSDGHRWVADALERGAVAAVVECGRLTGLRDAGVPGALVAVESPLEALQRLAAWYRRHHLRRVIAITGSNGKTIVKDALVPLLAGSFSLGASPGSFNSQIGVPLSLLGIPSGTELAVIEAGISAPGEMARLREVIAPDFGVLTNVGLAHIASFRDRAELAAEKLSLFADLPAHGWVLLPAPGDEIVDRAAERLSGRMHRVGAEPGLPALLERAPGEDGTRLAIRFPSGARRDIPVRARSADIVHDLHVAICAAHLLGVPEAHIAGALEGYAPPPTRMEIWRSPEGITLVNDAHSSDPIAVRAALRATRQITPEGGRRVFVFGGMRELGVLSEREHAAVGSLAAESEFDLLLLVGDGESSDTREGYLAGRRGGRVIEVRDPETLPATLREVLRPGDTVLFKGPRNGSVAAAAVAFMEAIAPSRLIVDVSAVGENILRYRRLCGPEVKVLAMVKALAYGSELSRLASWLAGTVDWLGVSNADEGIEVRRAGVQLPVLVLLLTQEECPKAVRWGLTPVIYSFPLVPSLAEAARRHGRTVAVHLKVDTGLGRFGVQADEAVRLAREVQRTGVLEVTGVMTHFASAEDPAADGVTRAQIERFDAVRAALREAGFERLVAHAAATAAAARFPAARCDMIRIGLGIFGVAPSPAVAEVVALRPATALVSRIAEMHEMRRGDTIGYGGTYVVERHRMRVGMLPLGYHDGIPWSLSNRGHVLVEGARAPIVGRISMDSMALDLSAAPAAREGSEVLLYGTHGGHSLPVAEVAALAGTTPYELMARLGPRVQRIYVGG